jgi:hypothetical protein
MKPTFWIGMESAKTILSGPHENADKDVYNNNIKKYVIIN